MSDHFEAPPDIANLVELAQMRAARSPNALAFQFLIDGETEGTRYTYSELDQRSRAIAVAVSELARPGERVLLLYEPSIEFIPALLGCFYANVIPVPAYPPRLDRLAQGWAALSRLTHDCTPAVGLSTSDLVPVLSRGLSGPQHTGTMHWIASDQVDSSTAANWRQQPISSDSIAFLQYTSGSTSAPRGVIVTHGNLLHNEKMLEAAAEHSGPGLGVCWLPLHHDMGLIGGVLQALFHGSPIMLMSPLAMLQRPARWLEAISKYRADTSGGPNFAYDLCVKRITEAEKEKLDLSNWSVAGIGAEPINPDTIDRFSQAFASCGFRPEAFYPGYGLAESTLFVTARHKALAPLVRAFTAASLEAGKPELVQIPKADDHRLVASGYTWMDHSIAIVDPETCARVPAGEVGEIWVHGPSVSPGYWNRPEENQQTFGAILAGEGEKRFLRSGDLGFVLDGELYVVGRRKEVLIVRGRNYYPQDIEATVQASNPVFKYGGGAVFEVQAGDSNKLVMVQELDRKLGRQADISILAGDVRQVVAETHSLQLHEVVFLEPGSLHKTTSGKIQRFACRRDYEANTLRRWKNT